MFASNKYTKLYYQIIDNATKQYRVKGNTIYYESHHIIPRSLGGTDNILNLVLLTAREHFLVHLLLVKMAITKSQKMKMACAFNRFKSKHKNSKLYDRFRSAYGVHMRGENNPAFGYVWCHDSESKEIQYLPKEEFAAANLVKGLPYQRGGFKNRRWVNNGLIAMLIPNDDTLGEGWVNGKLSKASHSHMIYMASIRHTAERDNDHASKLTGRVYIIRDGEQKRIKPELLDEYVNDGWCIYILKTTQKRFYEFIFDDAVTVIFKNYSEFCTAYNIDYRTCKSRGYDRYLKSVIPTLCEVNVIVKQIELNPRK